MADTHPPGTHPPDTHPRGTHPPGTEATATGGGSRRPEPSYGTPDWETIGRWLHLHPADDGPVWMLNLMRYREVAAYGRADTAGTAPDAEASRTVSGKEADDAYAPLGPLAAIGAMVALFGDVTEQLAGTPAWDRVGIVRYPSRRSFFEMQRRDDFKRQHVHKEAGMEFTVVVGCLPEQVDEQAEAGGPLVVRVRRHAPHATPGPDPDGVVPVARFRVDGLVVGDERRFDDACFDRVPADALPALLAVEGVAEQHVVVLGDPRIDELVASVRSAGAS